MDTTNMVGLLNHTLPDQKVLADAAGVLKEEIDGGAFDDLYLKQVPSKIDVVSKVFVLRNYDNTFGNHYITQVAIGGREDQGLGMVTPKHFFASLYYSEQLRLITVDFHEELR